MKRLDLYPRIRVYGLVQMYGIMGRKFRVLAQEAPWFRRGYLESREHDFLNWMLAI
jgi:hypothetical protein